MYGSATVSLSPLLRPSGLELLTLHKHVLFLSLVLPESSQNTLDAWFLYLQGVTVTITTTEALCSTYLLAGLVGEDLGEVLDLA